MSTSRDYVPSNAAQFRSFMQGLIDYADTRVQGWGIPPARFAALSDSVEVFVEKLDAMSGQHTPAQTFARNQAQAEAASMLRAFVNQYLRFPPVTDLDRVEMGIPNHDTIRTDHIVVSEVVDFVIHLNNIRELVVDFWQKGQDHKAKPTAYDGAVIIWEVSSDDKPAPVIISADAMIPASNATGSTTPFMPANFTHHIMASRTPFTIHFEDADRSKTAHFALAWQNHRGILGAWSDVKSAVIP